MSKTIELDVTCPQCRHQWKATAYRTIWVEYPQNMDLIVNDQINLVRCPNCGFTDQLPYAFMATNVNKAVAIWYEPFHDAHIDSDLVLYRKHYGEDCFWARAPRIQNWAEFKRRLVELNGQPDVPPTPEGLARQRKGNESLAREMMQPSPSEASTLPRDTKGFKVTPLGSLGSFVPGVSVHKAVEVMLTCPQCKKQWKGTAFRSVWLEDRANLDLILKDQINFVTCPSCGFADRLAFGFMAGDLLKRVAIWYEPVPDPHIDFYFAYYRRYYGADSSYAKAPRIRDWSEFKRRLLELNNQAFAPISLKDASDLLDMDRKAAAAAEADYMALAPLREQAKHVGKHSAGMSAPGGQPKSVVTKEDTIARLVDALRAKGHQIPSRISEIPDFPCQTFDALNSKLSRGELVLYRPTLSYNADVFGVMATRGEKAAFDVSTALVYVLPLVALGLSIFVRWPWALLCPFLIYAGWKMGRSTYTKAILRSAAESEMNFCFLFYGYKVGVALPDFSNVYVWEGSYGTTRD